MSNDTDALHSLLLLRRAGPNGRVEVPTALAQFVPRPLKKSSFFDERRGNVYENKGPLWKTEGRSWNVPEKKGT
jgi:hypothetical protein